LKQKKYVKRKLLMSTEKKIQIVEDEAVTAMLFEKVFTKRGYSVGEIASTGEDAVELARRDTPQVILMDIRLIGDMDGIDAAREIRTFSSCLIIFVTGYSEDSIRDHALALPNTRYFVKPVDCKELVSTIEPVFGSG
jgi:DNA-binding response OmpR family regulator